MEDYIFLIIAVVISIFAALKKGKAKGDGLKAPIEQENTQEDVSFDQWFSNDLSVDEPEIVLPEKKQTFQYKEPELPKSSIYKPETFHSSFKSNLPERLRKNNQTPLRKATEEIEENNADMEASESYMEDFSIRKAIIYSEILKPKFQE